MTNGSRVLLAGDAAARPAGLERALTRAGFIVTESLPPEGEHHADAVLVTLTAADDAELRAAIDTGWQDSPPVVVLVNSSDPDAAMTALALGADDALASPVHLPELCARLHARIRDRQCPRGTAREGEVRRALDGLVGEARMTLRPDEVVLALVRRLARAFDLQACSFVAVGEGLDDARVIAEVGPSPVGLGGDGPLDPSEYPAIAEAIRSRRTTTLPGGPVALPAVADGRVLGVLLLQHRHEHPELGPAQLQFAGSLAEAAAQALDPHGGPSAGRNGNGVSAASHPHAPADQTLDHRLQEEFERARRYSLSFSLVLLDFGARAADAGESLLLDTVDRLRRELRLPDYLSRYAGGELAIVLPETGLDGARRSVARMRDQLAARPRGVEAGHPSFSAGIVTYPHPAVTQADDMFALVEAALARGKAQVGERVGVAD